MLSPIPTSDNDLYLFQMTVSSPVKKNAVSFFECGILQLKMVKIFPKKAKGLKNGVACSAKDPLNKTKAVSLPCQ